MRKLIKLQFIIQKILGIKNTGVVSMHTSVSRMVRMHRRHMRVYGRAPDIFIKLMRNLGWRILDLQLDLENFIG